MLYIRREPIHKNKLFISSMAILAGFLITIAGVRMFINGDRSTQQSVQSEQSNERSSLIPVGQDQSDDRNANEQSQQSESESSAAAQDTKSAEQTEPRDTSSSDWNEQQAGQYTTPSYDNTVASPPSENVNPEQEQQPGTGSDTQPTEQPETSTPSSESDTKDCLELIGMEILCDTSSTVPIVVPWLLSPEQLPIASILP